jgi:glucoamylase
MIPAVAARYIFGGIENSQNIEIWKPHRYAKYVKKGFILRIQAPTGFRLKWTLNDWKDLKEIQATHLDSLAINFVDIPIPIDQEDPVQFSIFWIHQDKWEPNSHSVKVI